MTICERMFSELDQKGLTAYALCKHLGVKTNTTTSWKQRGTDPPAKYIAQICEFLGCSLGICGIVFLGIFTLQINWTG